VSVLTAEFWTTLPLGPDVTLLTHDKNGLAAFNKPAGVLSHPNMRSDEPRALLTCRYDEAGECWTWTDDAGAEQRAWLLNRLDSATSGVILVAGAAALARSIKEQFAKKKIRKVYEALVFGKPAERIQLWRDLLAVHKKGGQVRTTAGAGNIPATTQFSFVRHQQGAFSTSLIRLEPHTGRSHQLRVQCAKRHLPIIGDQTYGDFGLNRAFSKTTGEKRLFLHSLETSFSYEFGGATHHFKAHAPLPPEFARKY
jgi:23S rRNA pseudouridine955/2504/2580 synthase